MPSTPGAPELEFESLKDLLLELARQRTVEALLELTVKRLGVRPQVALARIWLRQPGDICASCRMAPECKDRSECLHLVASAGHSIAEPGLEWNRLDGAFARFPVGLRKVGHIAATGEAVRVPDIDQDESWLADPEWAHAEGIRAFIGEPIIYHGEVIGVLIVFLRAHPPETSYLRMIADHAATAIANARAFAEIERLKTRLEMENEYLREEAAVETSFGEIIGRSDPLRRVMGQIDLVAPTDASVLILGESGTGKELVARAIHARSNRATERLVRVNCASIPRELYESEFFGHVKGAFTGAVRDRAGRFEHADGGTLFLDEVGEIPLELQPKLLRVLQEGQFERVGDDRTRSVDVRIVAATNRDLKQEVEAGRFREDLYYRLDVVPIEIPGLRERVEDIPPLAAHFLERIAVRLNREVPVLTQANVVALQRYSWPGNVRELQNVIERGVITCSGGRLCVDLPADSDAAQHAAGPARSSASSGGSVLTDGELRDLERRNIERALEQTAWRVYGESGAAALLGLAPTTLASRMKKMGIRRRER